jgi:hypothetical protein
VPANFQRFLPLILIIFLLLFVLPAILKHHSSSKGLTSKELSQETIATTSKVDALQREFRTAHKGYTDSVADLLALDHSLGKALGDGVVVALDVSTDKQTYYAQVASTVIQLTRAREGNKVISKSCLVLKSSSGVDCPQPPTKTTTSTTTGTSTATTSSG